MGMHNFLAFDFGAESGRAILGSLKQGKLELQQLHRFPTGILKIGKNCHWNIYRLYEEVVRSLKICATDIDMAPEALAFDTWGVDYGLLSSNGDILSLPHAYRDPRTDNAMEEVFSRIPKEEIYELTGIQFMQLNSLFQLYATKRDKPEYLDMAEKLLFIPDLMNYLLCGSKKTEFSFATTSQLYNPKTKTWAKEIFEALNIPLSIMPDIVQPGTIIGQLHDHISQETGINNMPVVAVASHDTASAVVGIPAEDDNFAYISSGTWSLMGLENKEPVINDTVMNLNLTNEGGAEGTFRFLKNIMGLWLLQQSKKAWDDKHRYDYANLVELSKEAQPFYCLIDPDHHDFLNPPNMPEAIVNYIKKTGQKAPENHAQIVRCIFDSLALKYRYTLDALKKASPKRIDRIHIIGGGAQNQLLCQFTANATGVPVVAGPYEATAIGNIMMQALALGYVDSLQEIRTIIRNSFETQIKVYHPEFIKEWNDAYERFLTLID